MLVYGGGAALLLVAVVIGWWLARGRWPRRRRAYRRGLLLLHQGDWRGGLEAVERLKTLGPLLGQWEGRARNLEGECQRAAAAAALTEKRFEESLEHFRAADQLLNLNENDDKNRVLDAMRAEVYRLYAEGNDSDATLKLCARLLLIQDPCAEASFWQGLCYLRSGQNALGIQALRLAQEHGKGFIDPSLYLGALLLRAGQVSEALRNLAEANRVDATCPFVAWQLGQALVAAGGDAGLAARALQRALGTKGLPQWVRAPEKAWSEGFPGTPKSFVSRLATRHRFACPVFGSDVAAMVRQAFLGLSQAQYRLGNFQETANICNNLLQETAPSLAVLRPLGLALARLEKYDEAFKHLRTAHDMEEPKTPLTAGYLALCGACGKPSKPEDKANNVLWAIRLLGKFTMAADPEWAAIHRRVFAEARHLPLPMNDLARCCEVLAAAGAVNREAAAVYDHLAETDLQALQPLHAWLYCRAAQEHGFRGKADLDLFALAFRHADGARKLYAEKGWDFQEVEATYLIRWAEQRPGSFPDILGPEYPPQGERLLLNRSQQQEAAGQLEAALATTLTHVKLAPRSPRAYDRWACLEFRRGDLDQASQILTDWQELHASDPWPHLRRAALEKQRGNDATCFAALDKALALTHGRFRADVAFLGARLALAPAGADQAVLAQRAAGAQRFLDVCLQERPDHAAALWLGAALRWLSGDVTALSHQASAMNRAEVKDGRYHYMGAVAHLAGGDATGALAAVQRLTATGALTTEARYLGGIAHLAGAAVADAPGAPNGAAAIADLEAVALAAESPSVQHARALLGQVHFQTGNYTEAVRWWKQLDADRRTAWQLDEPLRAGLFLAGLQAYHAGQFEQAADRYREAGKQGYRDRRLGPLLQVALLKAGQRILYEARNTDGSQTRPATEDSNGDLAATLDFGLIEKQKAETAAQWFSQALSVGCKDPNAAYLLALAYKRQGKAGEARAALRKIADPDAGVWLQTGLLALKEKQPEQAEQDLVKAWDLDPKSFPASANLLLTRLSMGQTEWAASMAPQVAGLASAAHDRRLFHLLQGLLWAVQSGNGERRPHATLAELDDSDEALLLEQICRLGHLDTVCLLLRTLESARPNSPRVREAHFEAVLLKGKKLVDRCEWDTAERLLTVLARQREVAPATLAALLNLLGCCGCLAQNFAEGDRYFSAASRLAGNDAGIQQNLALIYEWQKDLQRAEPHWNRFFDLLERRKQQAPARADYFTRLAFEGLHRLAGLYSEKEKWGNALTHIERAHAVKPDDTETLERLFHLYAQVRRHVDARRALQQLRYLKPGDAQYELYELDLVELREIDDIDRWIGDIGRIVQRHPGEPRVEERAVTMVGNVVPLLTRMSDQLTDQVNKVIRQVRSLQNYQVNWQAVHDVMRDLKREFQKLRKIVGKCQGVVTNPDLRRVLRDLNAHIDRKIEFCREWQGGG